MQAQNKKADVLPRWMTKAKLQIIQQMTPEDAFEEMCRLRREHLERRRIYKIEHHEAIVASRKRYQEKHRQALLKSYKANWLKLKSDPERHEAYLAKRRGVPRTVGPTKRNPESLRERDRRKRQRIKMQNLAQRDPIATRKLICSHVPRYLTAAARNDVINSVLLLALDRKVPNDDLATWVKKAVIEHNRQFDHYKTVSIDAPIAGTDGLTRGDMLSNETPHF
ncbi:MAG: hypothetical protein WBA85_20315 [Brucella anthropi]